MWYKCTPARTLEQQLASGAHIRYFQKPPRKFLNQDRFFSTFSVELFSLSFFFFYWIPSHALHLSLYLSPSILLSFSLLFSLFIFIISSISFDFLFDISRFYHITLWGSIAIYFFILFCSLLLLLSSICCLLISLHPLISASIYCDLFESLNIMY